MIRRARALRDNSSGATVVEFAIVAPILLLIMIALIDLGYRAYLTMMFQGAMNEAARMATVGGLQKSDIQSFVQARVAAISKQAVTNVQPSGYYDFTGIQALEPITTDKNSNGSLDSGDCFIDYNSNGVRDTNNGKSGLGNSDDIIYYRGTVTFTSLVPVQSMIGWSSLETISAATMMRNQPYGAQPSPPTVCI